MSNAALARELEPCDLQQIEKEAVRVVEAYQMVAQTRVQNGLLKKMGVPRKHHKKNPPAVLRLVKKEREARRVLDGVSPSEWRRRVLQLAEPIRTKIGCLVWWDFFGARDVTERWSELDDIVNGHKKLHDYPDFSREELINGLLCVGYTSYLAWKRINESLDDE